ncbi:MAG: asparagine synthase (glutamine-hydrolyzing) [Bacteroidetes bacterium]|nr:asparagine synthase (glutamine-hydrolyzing) [Bacteroidota bacterium]
MCGITGYISTEFDEVALHRMTSVIKHRGPDTDGFYFNREDAIGLGHRRLSILDLSTSANQPFYSKNGRYIMVYNGEVYNYREIGNKYNIPLNTTSDTEVIIEGFALKGPEIFCELNGMFSLAIWDIEKKKLVVARDRIGIKPLFISDTPNGLLFASEIKSLLSAKPFEPATDHVSHFLYLGYLPGDETLFRGIRKFPAGSYGIYSKGHLEISPFWSAEDAINKQPDSYDSLDEAKEKLDQLLHSSINYRMISDVPLGTFLSGGIDSSTVTAIAQQLSSKPVKTFSIGFKDSRFNEATFASAVAKHLGTEHHEYILSQNQALELFDKVLDIYDEPFADSSSIPTLLVSEIARKNVTVALSGDGGDELFMGYGMYNWASRLNNPMVSSLHKLIGWGLGFGDNRLKRASNLFKWSSRDRIKSHIFSQEQYYFSELELQELLRPNIPSSIHLEESYILNRQLDAQEEQAFFDLKNYLKDDLLVKVDRASMYHSLEVRVPLLDHRIVEFALNLPKKWKIKGADTKYLLKQVLFDYVPAELFNRPKWGFGIPLDNWLKNDLKYLIDEHLCKSSVLECDLVNWEVVHRLKNRFFAGEAYLYNRLWVLLMLHKWYKKTIRS